MAADELVECFNCGRGNPEWAQACRWCGAWLGAGSAPRPSGPIPTDRPSLIAIGASVGVIVAAVILGLLVSRINPVDPTVGQGLPTPTPSPTVEATPEPETPEPTETPLPTASAAAAPPGTLVFGIALDQNDQVVEPVNTFTPGMPFAHSISLPEPFGVSNIGEQIVRINPDGTEEEIVRAIDNQPAVVPDLTTAGFEIADAGVLLEDWGPGEYEMRVYAGERLLAAGRFILAEG